MDLLLIRFQMIGMKMEIVEELNIWRRSDTPCPKCGGVVKYRIWESSCGGWEDVNLRCSSCNYEWWVDGCDS